MAGLLIGAVSLVAVAGRIGGTSGWLDLRSSRLEYFFALLFFFSFRPQFASQGTVSTRRNRKLEKRLGRTFHSRLGSGFPPFLPFPAVVLLSRWRGEQREKTMLLNDEADDDGACDVVGTTGLLMTRARCGPPSITAAGVVIVVIWSRRLHSARARSRAICSPCQQQRRGNRKRTRSTERHLRTPYLLSGCRALARRGFCRHAAAPGPRVE